GARRRGPRRARRARSPELVARRGQRRDGSRAAVARRRLVLPARALAPRHAARFSRALPSRQWRAARTTQFPRRHLGAGTAAVTWLDGQLSLRSRAHRAEPRGLCAAARNRCRERGDAPRARAGAGYRAGGRVTPIRLITGKRTLQELTGLRT